MKNNLLCGVAAALLLSACFGSGDKKTNDVVASKPNWLQASPILQQQIDDEARRLPWTHGFERVEQIRWFASVGEPAYPTLLDLAVDERDDVAAAALAALGATRDRRLVPSIQQLSWPDRASSTDLRLERARTLVRLGDWAPIPTLIQGLRDERLYTRSLCDQTLREVTGESFDFDARAEQADRDVAARRWEAWWQARVSEGLLDADE